MVDKKSAIQILEELRNKISCILDTSRGPEFIRWRCELEAAVRYIFSNERLRLDRINAILDPLLPHGIGEGENQNADPQAVLDQMWSVDAVLSSMLEGVQKYWKDDGTASKPQGLQPARSLQPSLNILENILRSTAMIMEQQKMEPQNETEINRLMKTVVSGAFPDTVKPAIPTVVKTYRPEFGVPSLAAVAEYKFAENEQEMKQCIDGHNHPVISSTASIG